MITELDTAFKALEKRLDKTIEDNNRRIGMIEMLQFFCKEMTIPNDLYVKAYKEMDLKYPNK